METKKELKEEIWSLPCMNYIIYRNSSLPEGEYVWLQELKVYEGRRSRFMGRAFFYGEEKPSHLFLTAWKSEDKAGTKNDEEWEKEIAKYPIWNKSKYIVKRADFGGAILHSDGSGPIKSKEDEEAIKKSFNK